MPHGAPARSRQKRRWQLPDGTGRAFDHGFGKRYVKTLEIDVAPSHAGESHQVSLYFLDPDVLGSRPRSKCRSRCSMPQTGHGARHAEKSRDFADGKYWSTRFPDHVKLRLTTNNWHARFHRRCFSSTRRRCRMRPRQPVRFGGVSDHRRQDKRGDWKGVYGNDGYLIAGRSGKVSRPTPRSRCRKCWTKRSSIGRREFRRYSYRKRPDLPAGDHHDNVQIAFNVLPNDEKPYLMNPPGTMPKYECYPDTDYEYALNPGRTPNMAAAPKCGA